ncbi:MAG: ABC transporter substrate-binding protein, partial [Rudaea sp.]
MNKYISFGIVVVLALVVAVACGGAAPATAPTTAPSTNPTSAVTAPTTAAPTTGAPTTAATSAAPSGTSAAPGATTGAPAAGGPAPTMKNPDTFVSVEYGEPESLDPSWDYETAGSEVLQQVYEPLVFMKRDKVDEFVGLLAEKWTTSSDGKTWTFNIRKNVKFHNGDTLTASDVAYSYLRGFIQSQASGPQWIMLQPFFGQSVSFGFMDPSVKPGDKTGDDVVNAQYNGDFAAACNAAKKLIVADDNAMTVTMTLKQPWGPFLASIAGPWGSIVDQKWAAGQGDWDGNCADAQKFNNPQAEQSKLFDKENGTGPYKLAAWDKGNQITLDSNDSYWVTTPLWDGGPTGAPKIKHVIIKIVNEWGTRFSMLQTGDADWVQVDSNFYTQVDPLVKQDCDPVDSTKCTPGPGSSNGFLTRLKPLVGLQQDTVFFNQNVNAT